MTTGDLAYLALTALIVGCLLTLRYRHRLFCKVCRKAREMERRSS